MVVLFSGDSYARYGQTVEQEEVGENANERDNGNHLDDGL